MDVLLLTTSKRSKIDGREFPQFDHKIGDSVEALEQHIKGVYGIDLHRDEVDEFPYFTDGGFRYTAASKDWEYTFVANVYPVIRKI